MPLHGDFKFINRSKHFISLSPKVVLKLGNAIIIISSNSLNFWYLKIYIKCIDMLS